jgi:sacsin
LQNYKDNFRSLFSTGKLDVSDVVDVVRFLIEEGEKQLLIGLPLLPLVTGNLAVFAEAHGASEVYTWATSRGSVLPWTLFGPDHFLHPDVDTELMIEQSLNVSALTEEAVIRFIELRFQRVDEAAMTPTDKKWIQDLWSFLVYLGVKKETISGFPLIPTYAEQKTDLPTTYLSFQRCENADVILFTNEDDLPHLRLLQRLGANFVKIGACSVLLQHFLSNFKYSFETVLKFFGTFPQEEITGRFRQLKGLEYKTFIEWIRHGLQSIPDQNHVSSQQHPAALHLREISAKLPVWEVIQGERGWFVDALAAAEEIVMLPPWVELSTAQEFLRTSYGPYAEYSETLSKLQVSKLDTTEFQSLLEFPRMMPTISNAYINLLRGLVVHSSVPDTIQVPNANGRMVPSRSLYSRSEALFHEIFSTPQQQYNLLHPSLAGFETSLTRFGLRSELDFHSFRAVAIAVDQEAEGPDKVHRAALAYGAYNNRLYGCILGNATLWAMLDNLRFIPRNALRRRSHINTTPFEQFAKPFAEVVSPAELLTTSFEPMAWTQRALFLVEPSQQLSISYPSLGQPTTKEVVGLQHILFLI